jgi:acetoin utilization deacetylase AcuC-like enzyme
MTVLFYDPCFLEHETGMHPESPERLRTVMSHLEKHALVQACVRADVRPASLNDLGRLHEPEYVAAVEQFAGRGGGRIETDTVVSRRSYDVALRAAGAAVAAVDRVLAAETAEERHALCLTRPPGHHALPASAMGFCLFNNVAIAARHAQAVHGVERVLIVDWDVHHGNGTQDMFYEDPSVCFFSVHRFPFYPGTGRVSETGRGAGLGTTFNLPLPFGVERREFIERFQTVLSDAAERSRPELILISAGFDAHRADPIGSLELESEDFRTLTGLVLDAANQHCGGRIVSVLEGGYNVHALAESVEGHLETLLHAEK